MDRKIERIIIEVTPEMRRRVQELNQSVIDDAQSMKDISAKVNDLQFESIQYTNQY